MGVAKSKELLHNEKSERLSEKRGYPFIILLVIYKFAVGSRTLSSISTDVKLYSCTVVVRFMELEEVAFFVSSHRIIGYSKKAKTIPSQKAQNP